VKCWGLRSVSLFFFENYVPIKIFAGDALLYFLVNGDGA